ncbi:MAG TPA: DUF6263 family protein [Phycisphaerae bacterium]|nr:DUF6263 family protein [Phycisphaerae bacterium]HRW54134.1 DUF6263 family protein [Phycisphaerae bacterium]
MTRKRKTRLLTILLAVCMTSPAWARSRRVDDERIDKSKPIDIRLKFRKDRVYFVESVATIQQNIDMGGQTLNQTIDSTTCYREEVLEGDSERGTLGLQFDRMAMKMAMGPMGTMNYDSEGSGGADGGMLKPIFEPMLHKPMTMELETSGKVTSFKGMDAIRDAVSQKAGMNMMWAQMQAGFSDDAAKYEYGESRFQFIPARPVKVGDTWTVEKTREMPGLGGAAKTRTEYKLADIKMHDFEGSSRRVAVIEYSGTIEGDAAGAGANAQAPQIENGKSSGTIFFDLKRGLPILNERKGSLSLKASGPMGAMSVSVTTNETSKVMSKAARDAQRPKRDSESKSSEGDSKSE